jgi:hypothetical protein
MDRGAHGSSSMSHRSRASSFSSVASSSASSVSFTPQRLVASNETEAFVLVRVTVVTEGYVQTQRRNSFSLDENGRILSARSQSPQSVTTVMPVQLPETPELVRFSHGVARVIKPKITGAPPQQPITSASPTLKKLERTTSLHEGKLLQHRALSRIRSESELEAGQQKRELLCASVCVCVCVCVCVLLTHSLPRSSKPQLPGGGGDGLAAARRVAPRHRGEHAEPPRLCQDARQASAQRLGEGAGGM